MVRPRSSGRSMRASSAADGGTGRFCMIGVATSPGQMTVPRMPLTHSSMLSDMVSETRPCLVAL
ncbi:hypothetical protein D3C83_322290 [compost metagenome]